MTEDQRLVRGRKLSPEEAETYRLLRTQAEAEDAELESRNLAAPGHRSLEDARETMHLVAGLRAERERQHLDLAEIARRTRYSVEELALVEAGETNPPYALLTRYARAVGKQVILSLRHGEPWCEARPAAETHS